MHSLKLIRLFLPFYFFITSCQHTDPPPVVVHVRIDLPYAPGKSIYHDLCEPLSEKFRTIKGITEVKDTCVDQLCLFKLIFPVHSDSADIKIQVQDILERSEDIISSYTSSKPLVYSLDESYWPDITIVFEDKAHQMKFSECVDDFCTPIREQKEVKKLRIDHLPQRFLLITIDTLKLKSYGLELSDVARSVDKEIQKQKPVKTPAGFSGTPTMITFRNRIRIENYNLEPDFFYTVISDKDSLLVHLSDVAIAQVNYGPLLYELNAGIWRNERYSNKDIIELVRGFTEHNYSECLNFSFVENTGSHLIAIRDSFPELKNLQLIPYQFNVNEKKCARYGITRDEISILLNKLRLLYPELGMQEILALPFDYETGKGNIVHLSLNDLGVEGKTTGP